MAGSSGGWGARPSFQVSKSELAWGQVAVLLSRITFFIGWPGAKAAVSATATNLRSKWAECPCAGWHTFRRTVASWMDEANAPLAEIAN